MGVQWGKKEEPPSEVGAVGSGFSMPGPPCLSSASTWLEMQILGSLTSDLLNWKLWARGRVIHILTRPPGCRLNCRAPAYKFATEASKKATSVKS